MSSFFGLCFGADLRRGDPRRRARAHTSRAWPWGASGAGHAADGAKTRAGRSSRLPQRGQMPGQQPPRRCRTRSPCPAAAVRTAPGGESGSRCVGRSRRFRRGRAAVGAKTHTVIERRAAFRAGARSVGGVCADAVGSAGCGCRPARRCRGRRACSGSIAPQARQMTALSESCAPHFGQSMARPRFCYLDLDILIVTSGLSILQSILCVVYSHWLRFDFFRRQQHP